jgi:hypothetical protein
MPQDASGKGPCVSLDFLEKETTHVTTLLLYMLKYHQQENARVSSALARLVYEIRVSRRHLWSRDALASSPAGLGFVLSAAHGSGCQDRQFSRDERGCLRIGKRLFMWSFPIVRTDPRNGSEGPSWRWTRKTSRSTNCDASSATLIFNAQSSPNSLTWPPLPRSWEATHKQVNAHETLHERSIIQRFQAERFVVCSSCLIGCMSLICVLSHGISSSARIDD